MLLLAMICYMDIKAPTVCLAQASVVPNGERALFETPCPALLLFLFTSATQGGVQLAHHGVGK